MDIKYWVAAHLTGIFEIKDQHQDPLYRGSRGAGVSINRGVFTTIMESDEPGVRIFFDGKEISKDKAKVTWKLLQIMIPESSRSNFQVHHEFEVPLSSGYGASAAGTLGCAFALNDFLALGLPEITLYHFAHQTEVILMSGLGDIIALHQGGLEVRTKEGAPGIGETTSLLHDEDWKIATLSYDSLPTASVLSDPLKRNQVNTTGHSLINKLIKNPKYSNFIELTEQFSREVQLYSKEIGKIMTEVPNKVKTAQIMLGDSLFLFYQDKEDILPLSKQYDSLAFEEICQNTVVKQN
ncbi:MAG: pantoate kinase [Candidatus Hodarchaeales archaeon]